MGIIDILHSIAQSLPEVKSPDRPPNGKERLMWTGAALILFFILYQVTAFGIQANPFQFDFLQTITASRVGSILTAGIGPIVLASIFLQLFVGAGLIKLNLQDKKDKQKFQEVQKIVAILLAFIEAIIFMITSRVFLDQGLLAQYPFLPALVVLQIALGSIIVLYLDEIVSKYGIGSGISLFIAGGVSFQIMGGLIGLIFGPTGALAALSGGGAEAIPAALLALLPFIFTIIVFFVVVYAEGIKVEIPIAFERMRGFVPRLPLKFFYVSNIPVIFASALLLNVELMAGAVLPHYANPADAQNDFIAKYIGYVDTTTNRLSDGLLYFITPILSLRATTNTADHFNFLLNTPTPVNNIPEWVHAITYILFLAFASILFGLFWVETSNMDAKSVSNQLTDAGMQIPGFRRDPRMLETILNKHIFPLTVVGSFSVGLLAGLADLTGALGTGTGILLTVSILYRMYEQMEQMNIFESYPSLGKMLGR